MSDAKFLCLMSSVYCAPHMTPWLAVVCGGVMLLAAGIAAIAKATGQEGANHA